MSRSRIKIILKAIALLSVTAVALFVWNAYERWKLRQLRAELIAKGEKLTLAGLIPAPAKPEENGAPELLRNALQLSAMAGNSPSLLAGLMRVEPSGKARVMWRQSDFRSELFTNSWANLEAELQQQRPALDGLRAALKMPKRDMGVRFSDGIDLQLPHLFREKIAGQWLALEAMQHLHTQNLPDAERSLLNLLTFIRLGKDEPLIITQLVRQQCALYAAGITWEALQSPGWQDGQMAAMQTGWQELSFLEPASRACEMERALSLSKFEQLRSSSQKMQQFTSGGGRGSAGPPTNLGDYLEDIMRNSWESLSSTYRDELWRWHWSYQDEFGYLRLTQGSLEATRRALAEKSGAEFNAAMKTFRERTSTNSLFVERHMLLSGMLLGWYDTFIPRTVRMESTRELAITAIALRRYQLRHGQPAPSLAALVPEFLPALPTDYMDGKPLRYRPLPDGSFLLYSIGSNGVDDGGVISEEPAKKTRTTRNPWDCLDNIWPLPLPADP